MRFYQDIWLCKKMRRLRIYDLVMFDKKTYLQFLDKSKTKTCEKCNFHCEKSEICNVYIESNIKVILLVNEKPL